MMDHRQAEFAVPGHEPAHPGLTLREAHHRIANDLTVLASMVRLQAQSLSDDGVPIDPEEAQRMLVDAAGRIDTIGRLHRVLWSSLNGQTANAFITGICADAQRIAGPQANIRAVVELRYELATEKLRALGLLVHELVLNALKHAHPSGVMGEIEVYCRNEEDGSLALDVRDDGVGFPEEFDPETSNGFGFRMIRELATQLDGLIAFESAGLGVTCTLRSRPEAQT